MKYETILPALFGAVVVGLILVKREKDKRDKNEEYRKSTTWKSFFWRTSDDFIFAIVCAVALGQYQKPIATVIMIWQKIDPAEFWTYYNDLEKLAAFLLGLFGTTIIQAIYMGGKGFIKFVMNKLPKSK